MNDGQKDTVVKQFEVEVECLLAGSVSVKAESGEQALKRVNDMDKSDLVFEDMKPGTVQKRGVYKLD